MLCFDLLRGECAYPMAAKQARPML
jgi:hypothetical protein